MKTPMFTLHIDHHVHVHDEQAGRVTRLLEQILTRIGALEAQERRIMSTVTSVKQLVTDIRDETDTVAMKVDKQTAAIQALKDQIAAGSPVTQEDLDAIAAELAPISERLKAIGTDPDNPIPTA